MIVNVNKLGISICATDTAGWGKQKAGGEEVWLKERVFCATCNKDFKPQKRSQPDICPDCKTEFIDNKEFRLSVPKEYDMLYNINDIEPIKKSSYATRTYYIEHSPYRFDIITLKVSIDGEYVFNKNLHRIPIKQRVAGIDYPTGLIAKYDCKFTNVDTKIEFVACFSYDINKKPGERTTLEINKPGNFVEINKNTLLDAFGTERCSDVVFKSWSKTEWIENNISTANAQRALRNALLKFEEPSLKAELAIKHGIDPEHVTVKNPTATKLHEILGISKAYLKFIIDPDTKKYGKVETDFKQANKKYMFDVYYKVGDRYKEFFKALNKFEAQGSINVIHGYQIKDKFLRFFEVGYDMDRLFTYLTEECVWQQGLQPATALCELYDYVNMCEEMELKDYERYPKHLRTKHDVIVMRYNSVKMNEKETKDFDDVVEKYSKLEFEDKDFILRIAKNPKELVHEGNELSHCVGSYASRMADESSIIFFMRRAEAPDIPYVTVELIKASNDLDGYKISIGDCRGFCNRTLTSDERAFIVKYRNKIIKNARIDEFNKLVISKPEKKTTEKQRIKALLENTETIILEDNLLLSVN